MILAITIAMSLSALQGSAAQGLLLGSIRGTVRDQQGAVLPGALVAATPNDGPLSFQAVADEMGYYLFPQLPPGKYQIRAQMAGFSTLVRDDVWVRGGLSLALDIDLALGALAEIVTVRRDTPLLESTSATTAVNISGDLQRALPLSARSNWSDFLLVTPAAMSSESTFGGLTFNYYLHGADANSHVIQIDGADIGSASGGQTFFTALSLDTISDVQVKTAGVDVSAPLGQGAVINLTTKSGSNELAGSGTLDFQAHRWNGSNTPDGVSAATSAVLPSASIGGPIIRDRLWFFGSYRRVSADASVFRTASQLALLSAIASDFRPRDNQTRGNVYFLKGSFAPHLNQQITGFYQRDLTRTESTYSSLVPITQTVGGSGASVRLSSIWSSQFTSQLTASYNNKAYATLAPTGGTPSQNVFTSVSRAGATMVGAGFLTTLGSPVTQASVSPQERVTVAVDAQYALKHLLGTHSLRGGIYWQPRVYYKSEGVYVNDGFAVEDLVLRDPLGPSAGTSPFRRVVYDSAVPLIDDNASDAAVYLQDDWSPSPRVTVSAGLRVDHISSRNQIFNVSAQNSTEIGPRFGTVYRLTDNDIFRASYGRVHARVAPVTVSLGSIVSGATTSYDLDLDGTFDSTFYTPGVTRQNTNVLIDRHLRQPSVDELTLGYRRQLPGSIGIDVSYVDRRFANARTTLDQNTLIRNGQFVGYQDESQNQIYLLTNNSWNTRLVRELGVTMTRQLASTQFLVSYSRQWRRVDGTWQPNDPAAAIQPDTFPNDRGIGTTNGTFSQTYSASSLSPYNMGVFTDGSQWRDHVFRLGFTQALPMGIAAAVTYAYQSGPWSGPVFVRLPSADPAFGPPVVVLSNGRAVQNPLSDTLRFSGATRSDGQFTLPAYQSLNAQISYSRHVSNSRRLGVSVQLFNLSNHDADQGLLAGATVRTDPNFGTGTNRQRPRGGQVSFRIDF